MEQNNSALVVLSGGQDSTTALFWARNRYTSIQAISFDYGQVHKRELECAQTIAQHAGIPHRIVSIELYKKLSVSTLIQNGKSNHHSNLPLTFVPGRNLIFLTYAAIYAYADSIHHLIAGMSQVDYSGYPDCRENTLTSLEKTLSLGMDYPLRIITPLLHLSKRETVELAQKENALEFMALTHTCYKGSYPPCGTCDACILRAKGFSEAGIPDPLLSQE